MAAVASIHARRPLTRGRITDLDTARRHRAEVARFDAVLAGLARHRTGGGDIEAAFGRDELRRLRRFFALASAAQIEMVRPRRKEPGQPQSVSTRTT